MAEGEKQKNKAVPWWQLIIGSAVSYGLAAIIGGIIGAAFGLLGLILLALGVVAIFRAIIKNAKR